MNAKLTLNIDKDIVERAKAYAREKNLSLSALVQNYFTFLSEHKQPDQINISPGVKEISGILELDPDFDLKLEHGAHILEKYK